MKSVMLDIRNIMTPAALQIYLQYMLGFGNRYGRNLDALYDELTQMEGPVCLEVYAGEKQSQEMQVYLRRLIRVMEDASRENPQLAVMLL